MVHLEGVVGEQFLSDGAEADFRLLPLGALATSTIHGKRFGDNYYNRTFFAANQASQALSLIGTATYTGLAIYNPVGSGVVCSIEEVTAGLVSLPTAAAGVVLFGFTAVPSTITTALTTYPAKLQNLGGYTSNATKTLAFSAGTLAAAPDTAMAPIMRALASVLGSATVTAVLSAQAVAKDEVSGAILLEPGTGCGLVAVTTAVSVVGSMSWSEYPLRNFPG